MHDQEVLNDLHLQQLCLPVECRDRNSLLILVREGGVELIDVQKRIAREGCQVKEDYLRVEQGQQELMLLATGDRLLNVLHVGLRRGCVKEQRVILLEDKSEVLVPVVGSEGDLATREGSTEFGTATDQA